MKNNLRIPFLASLIALVATDIAWSAGESCNALLNLGLYNVSQSSSAEDAQAMAKSTFCSYDYSRSDISIEKSAAVKGAYKVFSVAASGSSNRTEIIETQKSVCKGNFNSNDYSNTASAYSRTVYQGALDAWNKCQDLASKGLIFEVQPSSTLQGLSVIITAPTGLSAKFLGVSQYGAGHSDCTTSVNGKLRNVGPSTPVKITAARKVTVNCTRQMVSIGQDLIADAQDLVFVTSADTLTVPLAAIGSLARATVDQVKAEVSANTQNIVNQALIQPNNSINSLVGSVNSLQSDASGLKSDVNGLQSDANGLKSDVSGLKNGLAWETNISYGVAGSHHGECTRADKIIFCLAASHRYCQSQGFKGGFIQESDGSSSMSIVCVK